MFNVDVLFFLKSNIHVIFLYAFIEKKLLHCLLKSYL